MAEDLSTSRSPGRRRPSRRAITLVSVPLICLVIMSYVGDALAPTLFDTHPVFLMVLNSRTRNLVLVTNEVDPVTFYAVGLARLLISDPLFFLLGMWYGDAAVEWMERRTRTWGQMLRQVERWFSKAAYPIIFIAPNNYVCLFAGAAGMPLRAFFAVNIAGTIFRLWLVRTFGDAFERPIDDLVGWIGDHRLPLLALSVTLVVVSIALEARKGETEVSSLAHLDDELEELEAERAAEREGQDAPDPEEGAVEDADDAEDAVEDPD
jgi:membrane protein DedA with SNARE-associated domain